MLQARVVQGCSLKQVLISSVYSTSAVQLDVLPISRNASLWQLTGIYGGRYGPLTEELVSTINLYLEGVTWPDLSSNQPKVPQS